MSSWGNSSGRTVWRYILDVLMKNNGNILDEFRQR